MQYSTADSPVADTSVTRKYPPSGAITLRPASLSAADRTATFVAIAPAASSEVTTFEPSASASPEILFNAAATPSCNGVGAQNVVYDFIVLTPATMAAGPVIQPTLHPVSASSLDAVPIVTVRSAIPVAFIIRGNGSAVPSPASSSKVHRSYTSSAMHITSYLTHIAAMRSFSCAVNTLPVGLCGELCMRTLHAGDDSAFSRAS